MSPINDLKELEVPGTPLFLFDRTLTGRYAAMEHLECYSLLPTCPRRRLRLMVGKKGDVDHNDVLEGSTATSDSFKGEV